MPWRGSGQPRLQHSSQPWRGASSTQLQVPAGRGGGMGSGVLPPLPSPLSREIRVGHMKGGGKESIFV